MKIATRLLLCLTMAFHCAAAFPETPSSALPTIFITPQEGFETSIAAGLDKKHVPLTVVTVALSADYVLTTSPIQIHKEFGAGKIARCLFA